MSNNELEQIITEAESWLERLKALRVKHEAPSSPSVAIQLMEKQFDDFERQLTENPIDHNEKLQILIDRPSRWLRSFHADVPPVLEDVPFDYASLPTFEQSTGYTAVDMASAAADGFRDGAASKSEPCDGCFMDEAEALRKDAERYRWLRAGGATNEHEFIEGALACYEDWLDPFYHEPLLIAGEALDKSVDDAMGKDKS